MKRISTPFPLLFISWALLLFFGFISAAWAVEIPLFGPQPVVKATGAPQEVFFTFNSPSGRSGVLRITNGLEDDIPNNQFVATTVIRLNGATVVSQGTLTPAATSLDVPVNLVTGSNSLGVTLYGMPGGQITARILAFDEPPTASFSATPPAGIVPLSVTFDAASSSDADGDIVSYTWDFGDGAQASGPTQVHTFDNPGTFATRLTVTDVFGLSDEQTLSVDVVAPPNSLSGILLDTNAFVANGSQIPIVGAAVALLGTGVATTTDVNGHFILEGIPSGVQVLDLATANANLAPDGSPYASFRENITIEPGDTVVSRPFYLPRIDVTSLTPVDPAVTTVVSNPGLGITMTVAPGAAVNEDGTPFTGQLSISEVLDGLAPASMPEEFEPGLLVTIQPVGVRFDPPAAIVFPNTDSLAPGIEMDIWSLSPITGGFAIVGLARVSDDGLRVETYDGGIQAADWHFPIPPLPVHTSSNNNDFNITPELCTTCGSSAKTVMSTGDVGVRHAFPSTGATGPLGNLAISYVSGTANPRPTLGARSLYPLGAPIPEKVSATLSVNGVQAGEETFTDTTELGTNETMHQRMQLDTNTLPSGRYPYRMKITSHFNASRLSGFVNGSVLVNNEKDSSFGAGWSIEELQRLHIQDDGNAVITEGGGAIKFFDLNSVGQSSGKFDSPLQTQIAGYIDGGTAPVYADFSGDGLIDISYVLSLENKILIHTGDGEGNFSAPLVIDNPSRPRRPIVADVNADSHPDFITSNSNPDGISIFLADGAGGFNSPILIDEPSDLLIAGLFNDDPFIDLAVMKSVATANDRITILLGDGSGNFNPGPVVPIGNGTGVMTLVDLNADGNLDIFMHRTNFWSYTAIPRPGFGKENMVVFGDGSGNFSAPLEIDLASTSSQTILLRDFNNDGHIDLVYERFDSIHIHFGDSTGAFSGALNIRAPNAFRILADDLDSDGFVDLLITRIIPGSSNRDVARMINDGTGLLNSPEQVIPPGPYSGLVLDNVDDDMIPDFLAEKQNESGSMIVARGRARGNSPDGDFSLLEAHPEGGFTRSMKDGMRVEFDAAGRQTEVTDRNGQSTHYGWNEAGQLSSITGPQGRTASLSYLPDGKLERIVDPAGRVTQFAFDAAGNLASITDAAGAVRQFTYDGNHRLIAETDKRGFVTSYEYDFAGTVSRITFPDGATREMVVSHTRGLKATGEGSSSLPGPLVREEETVATLQDENGNLTVIEMNNPFGAPTRIEDPIGRVTTIERNADALPLKIIRPNGSEVTFIYDDAGNMLSMTEEAIGATTEIAYEPEFNRITSITDPEGFTTLYQYDAVGNLTQMVDAAGTLTTFLYDEPACPGHPTRVTAAQGLPEENSAWTVYDPATCLVIASIDPFNNQTTFEYDLAGNVVRSIDGLGRATRFEYDALDRIVKTIDATAGGPSPPCGSTGVTCTSYDAEGNITSVIDALGRSTTFQYDGQARMVRRTDPLLQQESFNYDPAGNLLFASDRNGQTVELRYDPANQLILRIDLPGLPGETITSINRDVAGNITSMVTADSALAFTYDDAGRLISTSTAGTPGQPAVTVGYSYDRNGNRIAMDDGLTGITQYDYDNLNRMIAVTNPAGRTTQFDYDANSRRVQTGHANSVVSDFLYDAAGRLTDIAHHLAGSALSNFAYTFDAANNRASLATTRPLSGVEAALAYGYDPRNQLTSATHPLAGQPTETFIYDDVGNRLRRDGEIADAHYDANNRQLEDADFTYTYDANGNTLSKTDKVSGEVTAYIYDSRNRLIEFTLTDAAGVALKTATYSYDVADRRIGKTIDGAVIHYVYDGPDILAEFDDTGAMLARYTHGPGTDEPLIMERGGQAYFYQTDGLGSVTELTDESGMVVRAYVYDSYGQIVLESGSLENPYTYTGREYDAESGLYYYRARYYEARTGRFLNEDLIGYEGKDINFYRYVFNAPTLYRDPSGLGVGHHYVPVSLFSKLPISKEVKRIFNKATTGPIPGGHDFSTPHRIYNAEVNDLFDQFVKRRGIKPCDLTVEDAQDFVKIVKANRRKGIRLFLQAINLNQRFGTPLAAGIPIPALTSLDKAFLQDPFGTYETLLGE